MKLFVTVGNGPPFDRLLEMVDAVIAVDREVIEGVCQVGSSRALPRGLRAVRQLGRDDFDLHVSNADVVICHGGVGTLATAVRSGHLPIALSRRASLGEIVNDHQLDLLSQLNAVGKVIDAENGITWEMLARAREARKPAPERSPDLDAIATTLQPGRRGSNWHRLPLSLLARWAGPAKRLR